MDPKTRPDLPNLPTTAAGAAPAAAPMQPRKFRAPTAPPAAPRKFKPAPPAATNVVDRPPRKFVAAKPEDVKGAGPVRASVGGAATVEVKATAVPTSPFRPKVPKAAPPPPPAVARGAVVNAGETPPALVRVEVRAASGVPDGAAVPNVLPRWRFPPARLQDAPQAPPPAPVDPAAVQLLSRALRAAKPTSR